jgi:hypothetical protein
LLLLKRDLRRYVAGMCERIVDHVNRRGTRLSFVITELTADFVKEADGTWWMLQVKAFQSQPREVPVVRELGGGGMGAGREACRFSSLCVALCRFVSLCVALCRFA